MKLYSNCASRALFAGRFHRNF